MKKRKSYTKKKLSKSPTFTEVVQFEVNVNGGAHEQ